MAQTSCCGGSAKKKSAGSCCSGTSDAGTVKLKAKIQTAPQAEDGRGDELTIETAEQVSCGCGAPDAEQCGSSARLEKNWITGYLQTEVGEVPQISTKLNFSDTLGSWKCRWDIGRMDYTVDPGLYSVGTPDKNSPVLVTANYKMTFDRLREQLAGLHLWIMVLDTNGVNVWCAAGEGTFGTEELLNRIAAVQLSEIVSHRTLILPQLGAVGVAAHEVAKQSGFRVIYGPIRAKDIKDFLAAGMNATEEMRTVRFTIKDRAILTPVEIVGHMKAIIITLGILFILNAIGLGHYGVIDLYALLGAVFVGCVVTPILLPWIPGRAFAFKGFLLGLLWAIGVNLLNGFPATPEYSWLKAVAFLLVLPSLSAFCAMNFTGCSTYTSLSGVDREMRFALPMMLIATIAGIVLTLVNDFILVF